MTTVSAGYWAQAILVLYLVGVFTGARVVLRRTVAAAAVALPLAVLVPWRVPIFSVDSSFVFPLAAVVTWVWWLSQAHPDAKEGPRGFAYWGAVTIAATACAVFAPQSLVLFAIVVAHRAFRTGGRGLWPWVAALLAVPAAYKAATLIPAALAEGKLASATFWLDATVGGGWNLREWFLGTGGGAYRGIQSEMNAFFYVPLLLPFAAAAYLYRRRWWFAPTFLWGAALAAGSIVFGGSFFFQYSLEMQMGLLVPLGIVGVESLRRAFRLDTVE